jgi:PIN domain nuclease of toxin-antitoxin system
MRVLLDTQVWLWMLAAPERLSPDARALVASPETELWLSAASSWEIAIKVGVGKLTLPESPESYLPRVMRRMGITPLPIEHRHALHVATLPRHHRDPFDRLLVAQAHLEQLPLMTADASLGAYDVEIVTA